MIGDKMKIKRIWLFILVVNILSYLLIIDLLIYLKLFNFITPIYITGIIGIYFNILNVFEQNKK